MAITNSVVRIYADSALSTLLKTISTSGGATTVEVTGLTAGTAYYATVQITTSDSLTSAESAPYQFFTLPDVNFASGSPTAGADYISVQLRSTTTDVAVRRSGVIYDTHSDFSHPEYAEYDSVQSRALVIRDVSPNTTYYLKPYVKDEFHRIWINSAAAVSVTTGLGIPIVSWAGNAVVGPTSYSIDVNISSSGVLTSVVAVYTPAGGTEQTINLIAQTGTQTVSLTGLDQNTQYTLKVRATNSAGTGESTLINFATNQIGTSVTLDSVSVSNENNVITVSSSATYDQQEVTLTGHWIELYPNDTHTGSPDESLTGGAVDTFTNNLSHANPDETYYVFSRITYTIGSDPTVLTAWSEPYEVTTYSLFSFGNVIVNNTDSSVYYSVYGHSDSTVIEYSTDQLNWISVPISDPDGGIAIINGLSPNTTYYLRGRCQSAAGWSEYDTAQFSTSGVAYNITITSVTDVTMTSATINVNIS